MSGVTDRILKRLGALSREKSGLRQGVVTAVSPLEVQVGGSSVSVLAQALDGVELQVNDRVSIEVQGSDLVVLGRNTDDPQDAGGGGGPFQPLDSDLTAIAALTTTSFGRALLSQADAAATRGTIGVVIGTDVQAYDSDLAAIAALSTTSFGRSLLTQANAAAALATIGAAASSHTHAQSDITSLVSDLALKAPLASPALTGNPTAPTQTAGNNSTRIATTAYADGAVSTEASARSSADALKADIASPTFTGDPKAPTPSTGDNDTSIATTAFVKSQKVTDLTAPTGSFSMNSQKITNAANATAAQDLVTLSQMQTADLAVQSGYTRMTDVKKAPIWFNYANTSVDWNAEATAATLGSRSGNVITGAGNGKLATRDYNWYSLQAPSAGDFVSLGDTFLLTGEGYGIGSAAASNGIWEVTQTGSVSQPFQLTRRADADTTGELIQFALVRAQNNGASYYLSNGPITMNSTAQVWLPYKFYPSEHSPSHAPSGTDPLPTGTPVAIGTANAAGSAESFAKSDHVHAPPASESWINVSGGVGFSGTWTNFGSGYNDAGYYKDPLGRVHLRGLVKSGTIGNGIFTLPSGYRPPNIQVHAVASNAAFGYLDISTAGVVRPLVGNTAWVSLDGITFRV